jgi:outer membrane lipoprotein
MMMKRSSGQFGWEFLIFSLVLLAGCVSGPDVVPDTLKPQVETEISFQQILADPKQYQGRIVVLGGEVLSAKRLKDSTQLEVLQLPLDDSHRPSFVKTDSQGRFLAFETTFLDPATFPPNTRVTIVGELTGATTAQLDEMPYQFPTLAIKHLHVWEETPEDIPRGSRGWYGGFGGGSSRGRMGGGVGIGF